MKKMDEMQLEISNKGLKISFGVVIFLLGIYGIYDFLTENTKIPLMILIIQNLTYFIAKTFYEKKYGVNDNEK